MPDIADLADGPIELHRAESERQARGHSAPESAPGFDGAHCVDCEDDIPVERLKIGKVRCVICQQELESRKARGLG